MSNLKGISMSSSKLLLAAKALSTDPAAPNLKSQLAAAARYVGAGKPSPRMLNRPGRGHFMRSPHLRSGTDKREIAIETSHVSRSQEC